MTKRISFLALFLTYFAFTSEAIFAADTNCDGVVNIDDLVNVITHWGRCPGPCPPACAGDVNSNCLVDIDDLVAVITNWG